jgi:DNA-binding transcriptional LysR family regulator
MAMRLARSPVIERFHERFPALRVEFVLSDKYLDLTAGDADVALRSGDTEDGVLIGRKIGDSLWAIYAGRNYVEGKRTPERFEDLADLDWIGFDAAMANHRAEVWRRKAFPDARVVARNSSVLGALDSTRAGLGLAALPVAIADAEPGLVRLLGPVEGLTRVWRVLTTAELRKQARVAAFFDYIVGEADALRPIITG